MKAPPPLLLDEAGIDGIVAAFKAAAQRSLTAGFKLTDLGDGQRRGPGRICDCGTD